MNQFIFSRASERGNLDCFLCLEFRNRFVSYLVTKKQIHHNIYMRLSLDLLSLDLFSVTAMNAKRGVVCHCEVWSYMLMLHILDF